MKTITVKDDTHWRLRQAGISGESMDVIINRALDTYCKNNLTDLEKGKECILLLEAGKSREELAELFGVNKVTINRYIRLAELIKEGD